MATDDKLNNLIAHELQEMGNLVLKEFHQQDFIVLNELLGQDSFILNELQSCDALMENETQEYDPLLLNELQKYDTPLKPQDDEDTLIVNELLEMESLVVNNLQECNTNLLSDLLVLDNLLLNELHAQSAFMENEPHESATLVINELKPLKSWENKILACLEMGELRYMLPFDITSVGREGCDININVRCISKIHAIITILHPEIITIMDAFSRKGTKLNDEPLSPLQPYTLHDGDVIEFGDNIKLVFRWIYFPELLDGLHDNRCLPPPGCLIPDIKCTEIEREIRKKQLQDTVTSELHPFNTITTYWVVLNTYEALGQVSDVVITNTLLFWDVSLFISRRSYIV